MAVNHRTSSFLCSYRLLLLFVPLYFSEVSHLCFVCRGFAPYVLRCGLSGKKEISIMVGGAISWYGKTQLVLYNHGVRLNAADYVQQLKEVFIPQTRLLFGQRSFVWMQVHIHITNCLFTSTHSL
jgi:hypothetical protein